MNSLESKIKQILDILKDEDIETKHFIICRVISKIIEEEKEDKHKEKHLTMFRNTMFMILSEHSDPLRAIDMLGNTAKDILEMYPDLKRYFEQNGRKPYIT